MSLLTSLYETYDACIGKHGTFEDTPLLPLCHTLQSAHVEIAIDLEGNYDSAIVLDQNERPTVLPCTEDSATRTSAPVPHALFDKLCYLSSAYADQGRSRRCAWPAYRAQLATWCASPFGHPAAKAVLAYLDRGSILDDLADDGVLFRDTDGTFPKHRSPKEAEGFELFRACPTDQLDALVRFRVYGIEEARLWENRELQQSWIDFQSEGGEAKCFCSISGNLESPAHKTPRGIMYPGSGAKLVSSNDKDGFTFRGRFADASEALSIGRVSSGKAHSALCWLINLQGYRHDKLVVIAWHREGPIPQILAADSPTALQAVEKELRLTGREIALRRYEEVSTGADFALQLSRALAGYQHDLEGWGLASIASLHETTPGRISVLYYREMLADDLIGRVEEWHRETAWLQLYPIQLEDGRGGEYRLRSFYGAPSPRVIAEVAFGRNASDKLVSKTIDRLLACIIDGVPIPRDCVENAVRRASRPLTMERWEAARALSAACSLVRKQHNERHPKEKIDMDNAKDFKSRDARFGCVLAYLRTIEERSMYFAGRANERITNAERFQEQFVKRPASTLKMLQLRLEPHVQRLHARKADYLEIGLFDAIASIEEEGMTDAPLGPLYLTGYASQYTALRKKPTRAEASEDESPDEETSA